MHNRAIPPLYILHVFGAFFILFYALGRPILDSDTAWHLASGEMIRMTGDIVRTNSWSFAAPDHPWLDLAWGWDLATSTLLHFTGAKGLFVFLCTLYSALAAFLAYSMAERKQIHPQAIFTVLGLFFFYTTTMEWARPQIVSVTMIAIAHFLLHKSRANAKLLMLLPVLIALWVNMHGGFIALFVLLGAYGLESIAVRDWRRLRMLVLTGIACLLAVQANPYGWRAWLAVYEDYTSIITTSIVEWQPYRFKTNMIVDLFVVLLVLVTDFKEKKLPLADKIACILWLALACYGLRHFAVAIVVAMPVLAMGLSRFVPKNLEKMKLQRGQSVRAFALVVVAWAVLAALPLHARAGRDLMMDKARVPVDEIAYIRQHYPDKKFLNDYVFGGYLVYFGGGQNKIFVDGRSGTAYPEEVLASAYQVVQQDFTLIKKLVATYKVDGLIYGNAYPFLTQNQFPPNWKRVYKGPIASVYIIER